MKNPLRPELQCPIVYCPSGNQAWIIDFMAQDVANISNSVLILPLDPSEDEVKKSQHKILLFEQQKTVAQYFSYQNFLKAFQ